MPLGEFESSTRVLPNGTRVCISALPTKNEDRTVILPFEHGTIIAIFDGHHADELSEYASQHLPQLVADRFDPADPNIEATIVKIFQDFDESLISPVYALFEPGEDWTGSHWEVGGNVLEVIGYGKQDAQFRQGRLAIVGTTVLMGILDKVNRSIWVVSLGDSDAVCGRMQSGKVVSILLSDRHNGRNENEVQRLLREHPGEDKLVWNGDRLLGLIAVTRALGDHQLKVQSRVFAWRILSYFYPSPTPLVAFEDWERHGNLTPPYLSSLPTVKRHDLLPGDTLVFASDGLPDSMTRTLTPIPPAERWDVLMSLVHGEHDERLGHERIAYESGANAAELLIKNSLFGTDEVKMAKELEDPLRDDISVIVVHLGAV